jgi:hypothetical protein
MPKPDKVYAFIDPTLRTRWVKGLLYVGIAVSAVSMVSNIMEYQLLASMRTGDFDGETELMAAAEANDLRQQVIAIAYSAWFFATAIAVLMWTYRANKNAHALGAESMRFTPGWAVGWYFIPIFNLWKPYQAMKEIWKASANPHDWQNQPRSPLLPWWWFFWIFSNIVAQVAFRFSLQAEEIGEIMGASLLNIALDAVDIPGDLLLIAIVGRICQMQIDRSNVPLGDEAGTGGLVS